MVFQLAPIDPLVQVEDFVSFSTTQFSITNYKSIHEKQLSFCISLVNVCYCNSLHVIFAMMGNSFANHFMDLFNKWILLLYYFQMQALIVGVESDTLCSILI